MSLVSVNNGIAQTSSTSPAAATSNPLLREWTTPFGVPPFAEIREEHYMPGMTEAMARQLKEIEAIAGRTEAPTFPNTIEALESTGLLLDRASRIFGNLSNAETNEKLQEIARQLAPLQAAHTDAILLNEALFRRVKTVWDQHEQLKLGSEQRMLLERTYKMFARGGALLKGEQKDRFRKINAELATLSVRFADNLLKEMNQYRLVVENKADLAGLPEQLVQAAADTAAKAGMSNKWVFTLHAPSIWPFLQYAKNRELRKQIFTAYTMRGDHGGDTDNKQVAARMAALRAEKARLLGFETWADYVLDENMAKTPGGVYGLLNQVWTPAKEVARKEVQQMQQVIRGEGESFELQPWDWFYYSEKVRKARFNLDEDAVRPYFKLENVREGAFWTAQRLYGVTFQELTNVPVYHPEVKAFEVKDENGKHLAILYVDYHPRAGKRSGAWCDEYRPAFVSGGKSVRPVTVNVCNFSRPSGDAPALLTMEEVQTLFHEFGHALHSMLSLVEYRSLGSTPTDFVELPSQIMENWAFEPEVLKHYAKHWQTGEVIPLELVQKIRAADKFNQGFKTVEYVAASLLDMDWHTLTCPAEPDTAALERIALDRMGIPPQIVPRYRSTYFQHIFCNGYSAGYYSYIWAEVLDADAFAAFKEKGIFDPQTARSFRTNVLEKGYTEEPMTLYKRFRGRAPEVRPLLEKRGLIGG